ncbi:MAG: hypothetical protein AAFU79_13585, partial [Myxococcota bacterium]
VIVELKPRQPGQISLGSGEQTGVDAMDNPVLDWLVQLSIDELGVAFHVLIEDRYVRVFEVTTDVFAGLNVVVKPNNDLELALGDLRIDNIEEVFSELIPNADFSMVLPTFLDLALGAFLSEPVTFDVNLTSALSDALDVPIGLRVNDLYRDGSGQDFLTLSLTFTSSEAVAMKRGLATAASLAEAPGLVRPTQDGPVPTGRVRLQVGEDLPYELQRDLEYQVRVDGTMWSVFRTPSPDGVLHVSQALLQIPGRHRVEVRARRRDDYTSLDLSPVVLDAIVDVSPPTVSARWGREGLEVTVRDAEAPDGQGLALEVTLDAETPRYITRMAAGAVVLPYAELLGRTVSLVAVDGMGHRSLPLVVQAPQSPADETEDDEPSGCAQVGVSGSGTGLVLLGLLAVLRRLLQRGSRRAKQEVRGRRGAGPAPS